MYTHNTELLISMGTMINYTKLRISMETVPVPVAPHESVAKNDRVTVVADKCRMGNAGFDPVLMVPLEKCVHTCTISELIVKWQNDF